jgi:hypothetical protein
MRGVVAGIPLRRNSGVAVGAAHWGSCGRSPRAALGTVHLAPGESSARGSRNTIHGPNLSGSARRSIRVRFPCRPPPRSSLSAW